MITDQKKLEELIYLSLIGNFSYKQVKDGKTYIAFIAEFNNERKNENQIGNIKPIYLTSDEQTNDKVLKLRLSSFESKVLNNRVLESINEYCKGELDYSRRIIIFIHNEFEKLSEKERKAVVENFMTNMWGLHNFGIIDKKGFKVCTKYVKQQIGSKEFTL